LKKAHSVIAKLVRNWKAKVKVVVKKEKEKELDVENDFVLAME
jgi:hypothetical protein